jgi:hypothetical protein
MGHNIIEDKKKIIIMIAIIFSRDRLHLESFGHKVKIVLTPWACWDASRLLKKPLGYFNSRFLLHGISMTKVFNIKSSESDNIKEDEVGVTCCTHGKGKGIRNFNRT